ncbi:putative RNA recognition motif domain, nucleotide-binding alpha-beta plait domain superfamily [Helianthus annuus]|nr:putative RNA recognition motif domain, nucleotide-binding alpha-beta plait domain superfamily [Helianthus annuus]
MEEGRGNDEEPWNDVPSRRRDNRKNITSEERARGGYITKYYITNLPPGCNPWDVAVFARVFGEVAGMYIARKKDKMGNRFGFLSFKNVRDAKELEKVLNGTKMGGSKLRVNVAKFANENTEFWEADDRPVEKVDVSKGEKTQVENRGMKDNFRKEGVSYKDTVASVDRNCQAVPGSSSSSRIERIIEVHKETSAFFAFQEKAVVGRTRDIKTLSAMKELLASHGYAEAKVYYVGGLCVLIVFPEDYETVEFLNNNSIWNEWLSSLNMWDGQSVPYERIAWIKFDGVPVHLAENKVFNEMAEHYGKVVHMS